MANHVMIDIETLGNRPTSVIASIGAYAVNDEGAKLWDYHNFINLDDCLRHGLTVDGSTIRWWMQQSEDARKLFDNNGIALEEALKRLAAEIQKDDLVWCNGASFDFPILDNAFAACGLNKPWPYYNERDFRTLKNLIPKTVKDWCTHQPKIKHNALADAEAQAHTLLAMLSATSGDSLPKKKAA